MYVIMEAMYVRGDSLIIKLLFLKDNLTLCYSSSLSIFLHCFSDPSLMEGLSHYIEFSKSSTLYSCSSSNPYLLHTCLKSILIVGVSWKITQVTRMLARLIFVRYEKGNLLGPQPSTLSLCDYLFWGLPSYLLLLGRIPISK